MKAKMTIITTMAMTMIKIMMMITIMMIIILIQEKQYNNVIIDNIDGH